ncbi:hypothetical protein COV16_00470 [Candidatus Woesearchaeota archaeon CG10_big_fil_rev_8_21_14_0_10_34_8]|nr:MAG: hypothetical protein COV16_00470 [Candidatus Woesearchaeota archaeon CG10_big_fil_rev_8_21_14_0_10_34_8]
MTKWVELSHENYGHVFPTYYYWKSVQLACKIVNVEPKTYGIWLKNDGFGWMTKKGSLAEAGQAILKRLIENDKLIKKIQEVNETKIFPMLDNSDWFMQDLTEKSGEELFKKFKEWEDLFLDMMEYSIMGTVMEFEEPLLSNKIMRFLEKKTDKPGEYFGKLTLLTKLTSAQKEERELCKLKIKLLNNEEVTEDINNHLKKYAWISFNYDGPGWDEEDIKKRLEQLSDKIEVINEKINEFDNLCDSRERLEEEISNELGLTEHEKYLCQVLRTLGYWKFERKSLNSKSHWMMDNLMKEIAKRCNIDLMDAKSIYPGEIEEALINNFVDKDKLRKRRKCTIVEFEGHNSVKFYNDDSQIIEDLKVDEEIVELKGMTAYQGYGKGIVKIVNKEEDMTNFNKGDILVSESTCPEILQAMSKANAIVTNSGGITCHAAIVAREIKIPTVIGTKIATKVLKDGDLVEVDADKGIVRIINQWGMLLHKENSVTPLTLGLIHRGFHFSKNHELLKPLYFKKSFIVYKNNNIEWFGDRTRFDGMGDIVIKKVEEDKEFSKNLLNQTLKKCDELYEINKDILKQDLVKLSNEKLVLKLNEIYDKGKDLCDIGFVPVVSDLTHNKLTNKLKSILNEKLDVNINNYLTTLITPTERNFSDNEKEKMLKVVKQIKKDNKLDNIGKDYKNFIEKIVESYGWLNFGHYGPSKSFEDYVEEIEKILNDKNIETQINDQLKEKEELSKIQYKYVDELNLNEIEQRLFKAARDFGYNKNQRYDILVFTYFTLNKLLKEISKRVNFENKELYFMTVEEIVDLLNGLDVSKEEIKQRRDFCVMIVDEKRVELLVGNKAKEYAKENIEYEEIKEDVERIHGSVAFIGIVKGKAKIVNSVNDIKKVNEGDIIVSVQTNPDLLSAMEKAGGFVTDVGGITCHAAIVAREMKKPCIIGTKIATKVLKDGDLIEVDAINGIIKKL